jgi:hypothetical protein
MANQEPREEASPAPSREPLPRHSVRNSTDGLWAPKPGGDTGGARRRRTRELQRPEHDLGEKWWHARVASGLRRQGFSAIEAHARADRYILAMRQLAAGRALQGRDVLTHARALEIAHRDCEEIRKIAGLDRRRRNGRGVAPTGAPTGLALPARGPTGSDPPPGSSE